MTETIDVTTTDAMLAAAPQPPQALELREIIEGECKRFFGGAVVYPQAITGILSALAPYLAPSADVRRRALEEAVQAAWLERQGRQGNPAAFELGAVAASVNIEEAIRALAGSPPSAPQPPEPAEDGPETEKPTLDELLAWAKDHPPSEDDLRAQRESWVRGEMAMGESSALAGSPPSAQAPGMTDLMISPEAIDEALAAAPQPPEPAEDVAVLRADFEFRERAFRNEAEKDAAHLIARADAAEAALAEAKAELDFQKQLLGEYSSYIQHLEDQLQARQRHPDTDRVTDGLVEQIASLTAERDRLAEALGKIAAKAATDDGVTLSGAQAQTVARRALSSLSAPEQPAEPSEAEVELAKVAWALEYPPPKREDAEFLRGCIATARSFLDHARNILAAKGGGAWLRPRPTTSRG